MKETTRVSWEVFVIRYDKEFCIGSFFLAENARNLYTKLWETANSSASYNFAVRVVKVVETSKVVTEVTRTTVELSEVYDDE